MMGIFSVYDSKAQAYLQPFFTHNKQTAIRSFATAAQQSDHDFHRYAADYTLFQIGEWDAQSGHINTLENKLNLGMASEFIEKAPASRG